MLCYEKQTVAGIYFHIFIHASQSWQMSYCGDAVLKSELIQLYCMSPPLLAWDFENRYSSHCFVAADQDEMRKHYLEEERQFK
jgi:hypothetical protein